jgi:hypothetical protein
MKQISRKKKRPKTDKDCSCQHKNICWAGEMAQWVKTLDDKSEVVSMNLKTHGGRQEMTRQVVFWSPPICYGTYIHVRACTGNFKIYP